MKIRQLYVGARVDTVSGELLEFTNPASSRKLAKNWLKYGTRVVPYCPDSKDTVIGIPAKDGVVNILGVYFVT